MATIKSLDDLTRIRKEVLEKRKAKAAAGQIEVIVGMGTCGIAAGARDTMKAILEDIQNNNRVGIVVKQTGCIGLCEKEPIVQVVIGNQPMVNYGKVTPGVARQILADHVADGKVVQNHVIIL
ncbi:MAG: (2Fe-2S) ferredoxin domain-containing protein [Bellilinea sp.]